MQVLVQVRGQVWGQAWGQVLGQVQVHVRGPRRGDKMKLTKKEMLGDKKNKTTGSGGGVTMLAKGKIMSFFYEVERQNDRGEK